MSVKTVTHPYGTTRRATVICARWRPKQLPAEAGEAQLLKDEQNEMHILVGASASDFSAKEGDQGTLTFTRGGPAGGYWKFTKDA